MYTYIPGSEPFIEAANSAFDNGEFENALKNYIVN